MEPCQVRSRAAAVAGHAGGGSPTLSYPRRAAGCGLQGAGGGVAGWRGGGVGRRLRHDDAVPELRGVKDGPCELHVAIELGRRSVLRVGLG